MRPIRTSYRCWRGLWRSFRGSSCWRLRSGLLQLAWRLFANFLEQFARKPATLCIRFGSPIAGRMRGWPFDRVDLDGPGNGEWVAHAAAMAPRERSELNWSVALLYAYLCNFFT